MISKGFPYKIPRLFEVLFHIKHFGLSKDNFKENLSILKDDFF